MKKDVLDELMPNNPRTFLLAEELMGKKWDHIALLPSSSGSEYWFNSPLYAGWFTREGLLYLVDFVENYRFPVPMLAEGNYNPEPSPPRIDDRCFPIIFEGLFYKTENQYLTSVGWPAGTRCWFTFVGCGWRYSVSAENPELMVARTIVFMHASLRWRDAPLHHRHNFRDTLTTFVRERQ